MVTRIQSDPRAREKPCLRCTTSLRAHLDDRYCPNCGLSVWLSLNANDALDASRPSWLRATSRACYLLAPVQLLALAAWVLNLVHRPAEHIPSFLRSDDTELPYDPTTQPTTQQVVEYSRKTLEAMGIHDYSTFHPTPKFAALALLCAGLYFLLNAAAFFALTTHEERFPDKSRTTRKTTRIIAAITAAFALLMLTSSFASLRPGAESHVTALTRDLTTTGLIYLADFSFIATSACLWLYLRPIATRGRRHTLRKISSWLLFLPLLAFAKVVPFVGFYFLSFLLPVLITAAHFLPALYIPTSIVLLLQYAALLRHAAPHAEQTWATESKPT